MSSLYIVSPKAYAGKTLFAITLAKDLVRRGQRVRYFKPVGPHPVHIDEVVTDKDALYITRLLGIPTPPALLCPVPLTQELHERALAQTLPPLLSNIANAHNQLAAGADVVLVGGAGSLFSAGESLGLSSFDIARTLDSQVLVISRYKPDRTVDELLTAARLYQGQMAGAIINAVKPTQQEYVTTKLVPYLEERGVAVFGVMPHEPMLSAIPVRDLVESLQAQVLTGEENLDELVERFAVGAMTQEAALSYFRKITNKAVITGGDRGDILLAALDTSLKALILTGGNEPDYRVRNVLEQRRIPVLLVHEDTLTTIGRIDALQDQHRFRQQQKIGRAEWLVSQYVDIDRLWEQVGIACAVPA